MAENKRAGLPDYAEVVVNVEAPLIGTFTYHVPSDLRPVLQVGHLVEVEFGRRLAQAIIVGFADYAPVEDTKPILSVIDPDPVVRPWQINLARWMSERYLAPLNGCLRVMLPPGLTRWADVAYDVNPHWDGKGPLTEVQVALVELLRGRGDLRSRQISRGLPGVDWQRAANQLVSRKVLRRASVLDAPRARPKQIKTVELIAGWGRICRVAAALGRANKEAAVLLALAAEEDPLPAEAAILAATGADESHLERLAERDWIARVPEQWVEAPPPRTRTRRPGRRATHPETPPTAAATEPVLQPAVLNLKLDTRTALREALSLQKAEIFDRVLSHLAHEARPVPLAELYEATGAEMRHLRKLADLGLVGFGAEEVWRDSLADRDFAPADPPALTLDQARVWGRVQVAMITRWLDDDEIDDLDDAGEETWDDDIDDEGGLDDAEGLDERARPFLIHGVTGSGKTEIYMRAIDFALARGRQAIVLVPEIALTPQTVRRFAARFPGRVAVLHSRLSDGERYDTWRRARLGLFDIIIGPRSALFSPLPRLGVIILDEEHDASYKQGPPIPPPYYHARDVACVLGDLVGAAVILGSATPDVVSYHRALAGRYQLLELPKRIMGHRQRIESQEQRLNVSGRYTALDWEEEQRVDDAMTIPLPPIQLVDMRQELRANNRSIFSRSLDAAVTETLARGEQAILFLNRRGTSTFVMCRDCGHVVSCPRCDTPLTYHAPQMLLVCHHCGRREQSPAECPVCQSHRIRFFGLGTEKVEEMVAQRWPNARLTRWDRDTTAGRDSHEQLLSAFINREADILIGTQMIAKGLDLPFVTLVGVISADVALGLPDLRTAERTFQLLAQVAGRAGRGLLGGRVVIQTYRPEQYAIQAAAEHDYAGFYRNEIAFRSRFGYPPYRRMARLVYADPVEQRAERVTTEVAAALNAIVREENLVQTTVSKPAPAYFRRLDGRYRWHILIFSPDPNRLLRDLTLGSPWVVDVDPVNML